MKRPHHDVALIIIDNCWLLQVLEALPETPAFEIRLGHRVLLDALLDYIGLPKVPTPYSKFCLPGINHPSALSLHSQCFTSAHICTGHGHQNLMTQQIPPSRISSA